MFKKIWPYLLIFLVWFIFAFPYFIKGNVPFPSNYQVNFFAPWSTYLELAGPVKNNAMPDIIGQIYPWKHFTIQTFSLGQIPLWNPYSFSGTPHLANYQSAALSPFNLLFFILPFVDAWSILVLLQPLLAGIFTYLLAQSLNRSKIASLISSVSFMFCGFITTWMAYATLGYAILFLPLILYGIEKYFNSGKKRFLVLISFSVPLSFFSGHFQISLYFLLTAVIYLLIKYLVTKKIRQALMCLLYILFGVLLSMPQLLPSIESYSLSLRSGLFQMIEVIPINYFPTLLAPDFFGNPVTRNDWFGHYAEWNAYIGLIPLILAIYSILNKKNRQVIYLFVFGILALFLAFNTPVLSLFVNLKIPVLSTSAASRIIVIYSFIFSLLAAFGYDELIRDLKKNTGRKIFLLLTLVFLCFALMWLQIFLKTLPLDKNIVARQNLILPTLFFITFAFLTFLFFRIKRLKNKIVVLGILLLALVSFDMLRFSIKWMPFDPKNLVFKETETIAKLQELSGYERFFGNLGGEVVVYYNLPSVEGYDAVYPRRYGEFITYISDGKLKTPERSVVSLPKMGKFTPKAINLLGIKYIVHKKADTNAAWAFPFWQYKKDAFSLIYEDDKYQIYRNNDVSPRAFLVNKYRVIKDDELILNTMFSDKFELRQEIVVEEDLNIKSSDQNPGTVAITSYTPNKISLLADAKTDSALFLSDSYFPGWKAYVNGKEQKVYRADYDFRALKVNKGKQVIEFVYCPDSFRYGVMLSVIGWVALFFILFPKRKLFKG